jgi:hypothetical protein
VNIFALSFIENEALIFSIFHRVMIIIVQIIMAPATSFSAAAAATNPCSKLLWVCGGTIGSGLK